MFLEWPWPGELVGILAIVSSLSAVVWLYFYLNRGNMRFVTQAHYAICDRLAKKKGRWKDVDSLVSCNMPLEYRERAKFLLNEIACFTNIPIDLMLFEDKISDALTIRISEVEWDGPLPSDFKNMECTELHIYDVLYAIERSTDTKLWRQRWKTMPKLPRNEDSLATFVEEMTMVELLNFFASLVDEKKLNAAKNKREIKEIE